MANFELRAACQAPAAVFASSVVETAAVSSATIGEICRGAADPDQSDSDRRR